VKALPGKPDIVLRKWKHIIFVDGCFWHRHKGCKMAYTPKSDIERWSNKFRQNVARDKRVRQELKRLGWSISTIWQCKTEKPAVFAKTIRTLAARIRRK
jgi:DNA mismatch endonuclease (patch repair protein)